MPCNSLLKQFLFVRWLLRHFNGTCVLYDLQTCMPQMRTPNCTDVVFAAFTLWLWILAGVASSPYCRVPIFRSKIQGYSNRHVMFSKSINSVKIIHFHKHFHKISGKTAHFFIKISLWLDLDHYNRKTYFGNEILYPFDYELHSTQFFSAWKAVSDDI